MATFAGFAVIGVAFFQFGVGIAIDRASPWETYLRTLPVGPLVRLAARLLSAAVFACAAALLLVVTAVATTGRLASGRRAGSSSALALLAGVVPVRVPRDRARLLGAGQGSASDREPPLPRPRVRRRALDPPVRPPARRRGDLAAFSRRERSPTRSSRPRLGAPVDWRAWRRSGRLRRALRGRSPLPDTGATRGGDSRDAGDRRRAISPAAALHVPSEARGENRDAPRVE